MSRKLGPITLLVSSVIATAAWGAGCRTIPFRFFPDQNDSVTATSVMDSRGCFHRYTSGSTHVLTAIAVATRPSHGTLAAAGSMQFHYVPKAGYKGADSYAVRICGVSSAGRGCSNIRYNVTIE
jgi:hypothetical protein